MAARMKVVPPEELMQALYGAAEVLPVDELARIEAERVVEREKLAAAEQDMLTSASADRGLFIDAKARRDEAQLTLEQLDWAEKAEHQRREQAERDAKMAKLREQQEAAQDAHARSQRLATTASGAVATLVETLRELRNCQGVLDRAVHYEQFAVNAGEIPKATVRSRLVLNQDDAVLARRAATLYLRLAQVAEQVGEMRAAQSEL